MPSYPNPYGPRDSIGAGLQSVKNIARSIFLGNQAHLMGGLVRRRSEAQDAEDLAQAESHKAKAGLLYEQIMEQKGFNAARTPEALERFGANAAGQPLDFYRNALDYLAGNTEGPLAAKGYSPQELAVAQMGDLFSQHFAANNNPNPEQFAKAAGINQTNNYRDMAIKGLLPADTFGDVQAATEGKPRYGLEGGIQYSNQVAGRNSMTPLGNAKIASEKANIGLRGAQAGNANAQANLASVRAKAGGFAPKATGAGTAAGGKRVALSKNEVAVMENQLADLAGVDFKKIDPQSRAAFISRASALAIDPESEFHRNSAGAMEAAVNELAPGGFEDSAGMFSAARFVPKGKAGSGKATAPGGFDPEKERRYQEWKARQGA